MDNLLRKITCLLLVVGTFSLIYWPRVYHEGFFIPLRYDLIFSMAVFVFGIEIFRQLIFKKIRLDQSELKIYFVLFVLVMSILLATLISFFRYDLSFNLIGVASLVKILVGIGVFVAIYHTILQSGNDKFYKILAWALIVPNLLLIPFVFFPDISEKLNLISSGYRFQGFTLNSGAMDLLTIIAFSYLYSFLMDDVLNNKKYIRSLFYLLLIIGLSSVIFWSQSRSFIIAMFLISIFTTIFYGVYYKIKPLRVIVYSLLGILFITSAFFLIPVNAQKYLILGRVFGVTDAKMHEIEIKKAEINHTLPVSKLQYSSIKDSPIQNASINNAKEYGVSLYTLVSTIEDDPRVNMWKYFFHLIPHNLLGLGVNYQPRFNFPWIYPLPPVFILNVWAWGGVIGVFCVCYLFWQSLVKFKGSQSSSTRHDLVAYRVGAVSALIIAWFISFFYGLPLDYIGFWIISALALI